MKTRKFDDINKALAELREFPPRETTWTSLKTSTFLSHGRIGRAVTQARLGSPTVSVQYHHDGALFGREHHVKFTGTPAAIELALQIYWILR